MDLITKRMKVERKRLVSLDRAVSQRLELWESTSDLEKESKRNINMRLLLLHI